MIFYDAKVSETVTLASQNIGKCLLMSGYHI